MEPCRQALPIPDRAQLEPLAARQQELLGRLTALVEQLDAQGVTETVRDPAAAESSVAAVSGAELKSRWTPCGRGKWKDVT